MATIIPCIRASIHVFSRWATAGLRPSTAYSAVPSLSTQRPTILILILVLYYE